MAIRRKDIVERSRGSGPLLQASQDIATLAAQQGVKPVERFEDLLGDFWPHEESADDFIQAYRQWRREGI